jgi:hypothetical protein
MKYNEKNKQNYMASPWMIPTICILVCRSLLDVFSSLTRAVFHLCRHQPHFAPAQKGTLIRGCDPVTGGKLHLGHMVDIMVDLEGKRVVDGLCGRLMHAFSEKIYYSSFQFAGTCCSISNIVCECGEEGWVDVDAREETSACFSTAVVLFIVGFLDATYNAGTASICCPLSTSQLYVLTIVAAYGSRRT